MARTTNNVEENEEEEDTSITLGEAEHPPLVEMGRSQQNSDDIDFFWNEFCIESNNAPTRHKEHLTLCAKGWLYQENNHGKPNRPF